MRSQVIGSPFDATAARRGPRRLRISGSLLSPTGIVCTTTNSAASSSAGSATTSEVSASIAPADPPITTMSRGSAMGSI